MPRTKKIERLIKKGAGWRVGWDSQADKYQALVGGDDWAIELTAAELDDFSRLLHQLIETMEHLPKLYTVGSPTEGMKMEPIGAASLLLILSSGQKKKLPVKLKVNYFGWRLQDMPMLIASV